MKPGEVYWADLPSGRRPAIVVSREPLNRGAYVVVVLCTTAHLGARQGLPHCVPFAAGGFGLPRACAAPCEAIIFLDKTDLDLASSPMGTLDETRLRAVIRAIGNVIDADCEPV